MQGFPARAAPLGAYQTLANSVCAQMEIKRSRFLCYAQPVETEAAAVAFVQEIGTKHWDARHNVWAYTLRDGRTRYSDDGEPQGTAGLPVLEALRSRAITDAVLVVTRYFGGILLGASGLTRAYASSAGLGIAAAGIVTMRPAVRLLCTLGYAQYESFTRLLTKLDGQVQDTVFAENVAVTCLVPTENVADLRGQMAELRGQMTEDRGQIFLPLRRILNTQ